MNSLNDNGILYINTWIGSFIYPIGKTQEDHNLLSNGFKECNLISYFKGYGALLYLIRKNLNINIEFNPDIRLSYPVFQNTIEISKFESFKSMIRKKIVFINNYKPMSGQLMPISDFCEIIDYFNTIGYLVILSEFDDKYKSYDVKYSRDFYDDEITDSRDLYYTSKICHNCDLSIYFDTGRNLIYFNTEFMNDFKRDPDKHKKIHFSTAISSRYFNNLNRHEIVPFGYATQYIAENFADIKGHLDKIIVPQKKTAVLYVLHEINKRVINFTQKCLFKDPNVDFYIIVNNTDIHLDVKHAKVINRKNIGWDFGGWSDCLLSDDMYKKYDTFIFANSTVSGPFLPSGFSGRWTDLYINGLKNNIKLFGSTINTMRRPATNAHIQSYIFSADREAVEYLIQCEIFSKTKYAIDFIDAVLNKEIAMSRMIIKRGWNIGSLMKYYNGVDFTFQYKTPQEYGIDFLDDVMYAEFHNSIWNEYEIAFIKGNRVLLNPTRRAPELL